MFCGTEAFAQQRLIQAFEELEKDTSFSNGSIGFHAIYVKDNEVLMSKNGTKSLVPASTMKIISTSTALAQLGSDFRFKTEIQYDGVIKNGVLEGNLFLKGFGDPTLGSTEMPGIVDMDTLLDIFAKKVKAAGITKITGKIIGDASHWAYDGISKDWLWEDIGNGFGAGAYGLNIKDNTYELVFKRAKIGAKPKLYKVFPYLPGDIRFDNQLKAGSSTEDANIYLAPYTNAATVSGILFFSKATRGLEGAIPDVELFAAEHFCRALRNVGVECLKGIGCQRISKINLLRKILYVHSSPILSDIVKEANLESVNLYCEAMTKAIGDGNSQKGCAAMVQFWKDRGIQSEGWFCRDGSGLSAKNAITPKHLSEILRKIRIDEKKFPTFYESLPVAGKNGTLKSMCKGTAADGNIHAKSGSMTRVCCYAGYGTTKSGREVAFTLMLNNFSGKVAEARKQAEKIMVAIAELP